MMNRIVIIGLFMISLGLMMSSKYASGAESPEKFYRGKTLHWVSTTPGDGQDRFTRIIAPFLAKEIGAVKVIIENTQTDEGMNILYRGSRDGLTLGIKTSDAIIMGDILKAPGVRYETEKFNFIADVYPSVKVVQISPKLPCRTLDALRKAKGLRGGGTSAR